MSYVGIVTRIHTRPHLNADRLQVGTVMGNQVVVGLDTQDGELGVFFPTDGQLSQEMCDANDLIGRTDPVTGKHEGGFFSDKRRVRAQKFRGEKSDGYWCPLSALAWTGHNLTKLKEGDTFTELNGHEVCRKYFTPATLRAMNTGKKTSRASTIFFPKHPDTPQFRFVSNTIQNEAIIYVTEKVHGTSGRYGRVLDDYLPTWKQWVNKVCAAMHMKRMQPTRRYVYMHGSRNVILDDSKPGFYWTNEFRYRPVESISLHKGEMLYFELVGYAERDRPIMRPQPINDKDVKKQFGDFMLYKYGCTNGEARLYVYRITRTNEDGVVTELSWPQMVARCKELGLQHVPLLTTFYYPETAFAGLARSDQVPEYLHRHIDGLARGVSTLDPSHIREGVVLRVEQPDGTTTWIKHKQWLFGVLEGYIKDAEDYVDAEEVA